MITVSNDGYLFSPVPKAVCIFKLVAREHGQEDSVLVQLVGFLRATGWLLSQQNALLDGPLVWSSITFLMFYALPLNDRGIIAMSSFRCGEMICGLCFLLKQLLTSAIANCF